MTRIPIAEHPSNLDAAVRCVREDRAGNWIVYAIKGLGFVLISNGMATVGIYPTEAAALAALRHIRQAGTVH